MILALALGAAPSALDPFDDNIFDKDTWNRWRGSFDNDNERGHMARSLIRQLEARRDARTEVLELLGPPDMACGALTPPVGSVDTCLSYNLGAWSGFRMDLDTLDVYFGANGRVTKAVTVQH